MSDARRAGIPPSYVMDVWLAAVERQRTKLESATFPTIVSGFAMRVGRTVSSSR